MRLNKSKNLKMIVAFTSIAAPLIVPAQLLSAPNSKNYEIADKEEAFLVRRIAEFWKDQDYQLVKTQILDFIAQYPHSKLNEHLRCILGDLYLQENDYNNALLVYEQISDKMIYEKLFVNKMQCFYELGQYAKMVSEGTPHIDRLSKENAAREKEFHFLMAEAYFRLALSLDDVKEKANLVEQAERLYERISDSNFRDPTMFALAEIYRMRGKNQESSNLFIELAAEHPEKEEELLYHAGLAQADFDRNLAINTFSRIAHLGGVKTKDAKVNRLILLFQEEKFSDVINSSQDLILPMDDPQRSTIDYIVGRSYFATENYQKASSSLAKYISSEQENSPQYRNALLMQMNCAQTLQNEDLYQANLEILEKLFPNDVDLPQAIFIHAMMLKDEGETTLAEKKLEFLLTQHPNFTDQENLQLEYSLVTYNNENWESSHTALKKYLREFPQSSHAKAGWKYFLSSSLNLIKEMEEENTNQYTKQEFLQDLTNVLAQDNVLSDTELQECRFLHGKVAYEIGSYDLALEDLNAYLMSYPSDPTNAEAHLLVSLCYHQKGSDPKAFCEHAEIALAQSTDLKNRSSIHLELYNVYLSLVSKLSDSKIDAETLKQEKEALYEKAAENLYQALSLQDIPIRLENRLWLANFYYNKLSQPAMLYEKENKVHDDALPLFEKTYNLFSSVLMKEGTSQLVTIDESHLFLEWEVLKLANLAGRQNQHDIKIALLKDLAKQQSLAKNFAWRLNEETLLELAKTYEYVEDYDNAYDTFCFIVDHHVGNPSFASKYAALHSVRLRFQLIKAEDQNEKNAEVISMLNELKELQIKKHASSEPLHLEAALEYAWIRAQLAQEEQKDTKYLFFLERLQDDFSNTDDPIAAKYHQGMNQDREKKTLYDTYNLFLNAELLRTKAKIEHSENHIVQAEELNSRALENLSQIKERPYISHYLNHRVRKSIESIGKAELF